MNGSRDGEIGGRTGGFRDLIERRGITLPTAMEGHDRIPPLRAVFGAARRWFQTPNHIPTAINHHQTKTEKDTKPAENSRSSKTSARS